MLRFILFLTALTWAMPGYATIDSDADQIGIYFDTDASETCYGEYAGTRVIAYVIITNPSLSDVRSVAFSFCPDIEGHELDVSISLGFPPGCWFDPVETDPCSTGIVLPCDISPSPAGTEVIVGRFRIIMFELFPLDLYLGPFHGREEWLSYWAGEDLVEVPLGVASGDVSLPVASINGDCPVSVTETTFGRVKSLYR